jgi:predicted transcriptional regulator
MSGPILIKEKQVRILLLLKNNQQAWRIGTLAVASGTTYVHTHNFLKSCSALGITSMEKHGKIKEIKLTEKGSQLADSLAVVYAAISQPPQQAKQEEKPAK